MTGAIAAPRSAPTITCQRASLEEQGYVVIRSAVGASRVLAAQRLLISEIARSGIDPEEVLRCQQSTFFPHLRWRLEIWDLVPPAAEALVRQDPQDEWGEAQLLLRFPDDAANWPLEPHVDDLPPWASERSYRDIVGVALTAAGPEDGCLRVWPGSHLGHPSEPVAVPLDPGGCVVMLSRVGTRFRVEQGRVDPHGGVGHPSVVRCMIMRAQAADAPSNARSVTRTRPSGAESTSTLRELQ